MKSNLSGKIIRTGGATGIDLATVHNIAGAQIVVDGGFRLRSDSLAQPLSLFQGLPCFR